MEDDKTLVERIQSTPSPPALAPLMDEVKNTLTTLEQMIAGLPPGQWRTEALDAVRDGVKG